MFILFPVLGKKKLAKTNLVDYIDRVKNIQYIVYKEGKYYVSRCLNFEVASFGNSVKEAEENLREAVELYLEEDEIDFASIEEITVKEFSLNA